MARKSLHSVVVASFLALAACVTVENSYEKAQVYGWEDDFDTVVLHLHGCGGDPLMEGVMFMLEQGYTVVTPDSFADQRPKASCRPPWPNKDQIFRVRTEQAEYALEQIRLEYPGKKVIVWGHSEGGGVANRISEPVDGVITTGYHCGYRSQARTSVSKDTPLLVLVGKYDGLMDDPVRRTNSGTIEALCERVMGGSPKWKYLIVEAGHRPSIRGTVKEAILEFLAAAQEG